MPNFGMIEYLNMVEELIIMKKILVVYNDIVVNNEIMSQEFFENNEIVLKKLTYIDRVLKEGNEDEIKELSKIYDPLIITIIPLDYTILDEQKEELKDIIISLNTTLGIDNGKLSSETPIEDMNTLRSALLNINDKLKLRIPSKSK